MSRAIMQCQSYFPSYNSHYDLNVDTNGGVRPIYNGNGIFPSGHYSNYVFSLPRECVRQTIVMHEVTFRQQVQELHRLYRRQKELMGEIESNQSYISRLNSELQGSESLSAKLVHNATVSGNGRDLGYESGLESKGRKIGRKLLDLELPAEAYIDTDDLITEGEPSCSRSFAHAKTNLADLNEPLIASDMEVSERNHDLLNNGNRESPCKLPKSWVIDINLPCDPTTDEDEQPMIEDDKLPQKSSFLENSSLEIDLEAPLSPELEEHPPPRGESEETQSEEPSLEELVKIAADAIVSISSSSTSVKSQQCPEKTETLEWFADLVHSLSILDEFEAMTLNLPEMKVEEYMCQNKFQMEESISVSYSRKGRTTRSKRKDFQREILPSLSSLTRYEVTEDIQMIEGLMEAAGTPWHLSRGARRRKPRLTKPEELESRSGTLLGCWGKANKRPRGRRSPASPSSVESKWLEYLN